MRDHAVAEIPDNRLLNPPEAVGRLAISKLDVKDWAFGSGNSQRFWGTPRLVNQFANLGREDLAAALRHNLLRCANPRNFSAPYGALLDVAVLLSGDPQPPPQNIETFVNKICTVDWLRVQYQQTHFGLLAGALVLLGVSQSPKVLRYFWSDALTRRIEVALASLATAGGNNLCLLVQFLGAAQLIGRRVPRQTFGAAVASRIAQLPTEVLPHRSESVGIEHYQMNLWLGLRAVASLSSAVLAPGNEVIEETLERWRLSLAESAEQSIRHRLDNSMVAWLEASASNGNEILLPSKEPLWVIAGFGWNPAVR